MQTRRGMNLAVRVRRALLERLGATQQYID